MIKINPPPRFALIACANGLGHVRRCAALANALVTMGAAATLFAPAAAVKRILVSSGAVARFDTVPFDTQTSAEALQGGRWSACRWTERLPRLETFDLVISDNLPDILGVRPDAVLSGNFLWHRSLPDVHPVYRSMAQRLLSGHRPPMIVYGPFLDCGLAEEVQVIQVGLPRLEKPVPGRRRRVLISSGLGGKDTDRVRDQIEMIARGPRPPVDEVVVEPSLLPAHAPVWFRSASFSPEMYGTLVAAVCRPGMGTLTECLIAGARVFAYYGADTDEMRHNARWLTELGVGTGFLDVAEAWEAALYYLLDPVAQKRHASAVGVLACDGAEAAARILFARIGITASTHFPPEESAVDR